jgi:mannosyltransferase OCH1-like enzyme
MIKKLGIIILLIIIIFIIFYILNKIPKNVDRFENSKIPKIIIQTWKDINIPEKYKKDIESINKYNPDFKYMFFTDEDIDYFIKKHYPEYYSTYLKLPIIIQKIDFFRYIAIYHYGGFYFDLDITGLAPIKELLHYDCIFPIDENISHKRCELDRLKKYCDKGQFFLLGQYAFGAKPKNNFIKKLIDIIHINVDNYIKNVDRKSLDYVYKSTGPDFVTDVYMDYKHKDTVHILHYNKSQYFGKYAKHNHYGTWK